MQVGFGALQRYYNIVYDQAVSPSGNYLATCDSYGQISTFKYAVWQYIYWEAGWLASSVHVLGVNGVRIN